MSSINFSEIGSGYIIVFPHTVTDPYDYDNDTKHYLDYIQVSEENLEDKIQELIKSGNTKFKVFKNIDFNYTVSVNINKDS